MAMNGSPQSMGLDEKESAPSGEATPPQHRDEPEDLPPSAPEAHAPPPPHKLNPPSAKLQELTSRVLQFLSTASNETLAACVVALCASTYLVLGRIGLVLLGVLGGVILHASWEGSGGDGSDVEFKANETKRRRELGIVVAQKALRWRETSSTPESAEANQADVDVLLSSQKELGFQDYQPATGAALKTFTDAVIRDYVKWWYGPILPSEDAFPFSCRQILNGFVISISSHLSRKRPADTFLDFLTNSCSIIIVFLNELSTALVASDSSSSSPSDAVHKYLELNPESSLANVLSLKQQKRKLTLVADDVLQTFLDSKAYNFEPVKVFLREVFAGLVLEPSVANASRPEWINEWIIYLLEDGEPEILNAIDAGVDSVTPQQLSAAITNIVDEDALKGRQSAESSNVKLAQDAGHRRRVSRAEDAMDQAMMEAKNLSEMIAAEEATKGQEENGKSESISGASTTTTTEGIVTPTSSDSDRNGHKDPFCEDFQVSEQNPMRTREPTTPKTEQNFTDFDQLASWQPPTPAAAPLPPPVFTLHNANISIFEDSLPGEKAKPTADFLLQIEPASSQASGWMIQRKYHDFEQLHEFLRRISVVSGVSAFAQQHGVLPIWKGQTKSALSQQLERYLQSALKYDRLAESGGMKKFLDKDQGLGKASAANKPAFGFPNTTAFETMGKGMLDGLGTASKGVVGGGKAVLGGVTGVFGVVGGSGQKRPKSSVATRGRGDSVASTSSGPSVMRESQDDFRTSTETPGSTVKPPPLPRRPTERLGEQADVQYGNEASSSSTNLSTTESGRPSLDRMTSEEERRLPPPPSAISDDYGSKELVNMKESSSVLASPDTVNPPKLPERPARKAEAPFKREKAEEKAKAPMTEGETQMAVELFFAVIQELYTLSSAWNIRRTLLNAAKTFLLRPGNPNLESIRLLLQNSVIDANTSDEGLAAHILKLRENTLPTEEELKQWPPPASNEEKEKLRLKARKLLVERGMPQALMSVMGAAASGEALGRVFDCLQVEEVARGLMFALLLQAVRAATQ